MYFLLPLMSFKTEKKKEWGDNDAFYIAFSRRLLLRNIEALRALCLMLKPSAQPCLLS